LKGKSGTRKVQSLETHVQELEAERQDLISSHVTLQEGVERSRIDISDKDMEISELQEKMKRMEELLKEVASKKEELVIECDELRLQSSTLEERLHGVESGYSASSMEFEKKLGNTNQRLQACVKERDGIRTTMNQELEKLTRERDDALGQVDDYHGRERRYKLAYENLRMRMQMEHSSWKRHLGFNLMHVGDSETLCVDTLRKIEDGVRKCEQTFSAWEAGHRNHVLSLQTLSREEEEDSSLTLLSWKEECGALASQELGFCDSQSGMIKKILSEIGLENGRKGIMNVLSSLREALESVPEDIVFSSQEEFDERTSGVKREDDGRTEDALPSTFTPAARSTPLSSLLRSRRPSSSLSSSSSSDPRFSLQRQQSTPVGLGRNLSSLKSSFASPSSRTLI
jgi:myosin heavy subunit